MIFVSAGHHPYHPGVSYNGFSEHDEAVRWRDRIVEWLGHTVPLDVLAVPVGSLQEKMLFINNRHPGESFAVEIHFDGNRDNPTEGEGSQTLFHPDVNLSRELATRLQRAYGSVMPPNNGVAPGWFKKDPKFGPDFFLMRTRCPSVIVVPGYIHQRDVIRDAMEDACVSIASTLWEAQLELKGETV